MYVMCVSLCVSVSHSVACRRLAGSPHGLGVARQVVPSQRDHARHGMFDNVHGFGFIPDPDKELSPLQWTEKEPHTSGHPLPSCPACPLGTSSSAQGPCAAVGAVS